MEGHTQIALNPDDPNRCKGIKTDGQCKNLASPGQLYCLACAVDPLAIRRRMTVYKLTKASDQERVADLAAQNQIILLKNTLLIMHVLIEELVNTRKDANDPNFVDRLTKLAGQINSIEGNLAKWELAAHEVFGRDALTHYTYEVGRIINEELMGSGFKGWEPIQRRIGERLLVLVTGLKNPLPENER